MVVAPLRPYRSFFAARLRMLLQYRGAAFGGMVTQVVFGLILVMVYEAFSASSNAPQPMSFAQVRSYIWLGQALLALLPWNVEAELRVMIRTGGVAHELLRPLRLYPLWLARTLASRLAPALLRALPIFALALASFGLELPPSPAAALAWLAATAGAVLLLAAAIAIDRTWLRKVFTYVVPLAAVTCFPGLAIIGKADPLGTGRLFQSLAPLAGPAFLALSMLVWRIGVRHYQSTGS